MSPTTKSGVIAASIVLGVALIIGVSLGLSGGNGRNSQASDLPSEGELLDKITSHAFWTTKPSRAKVEQLADFAIKQSSSMIVIVDSDCRYTQSDVSLHRSSDSEIIAANSTAEVRGLANQRLFLDMEAFRKRPSRQEILFYLSEALDRAEFKQSR